MRATLTEPTTGSAAERPRRVDASRNRDRLITAAREAFVEHGPDVALDAIAHRAGVGNATLYRHFPDRGELVHAVALNSMARIAELAEAAYAEESDPFQALRRFAHAAADERVGSLSSLLCKGFDKYAPEVVESRSRLESAVRKLMEQARHAGTLRPDVEIGDLMTGIMQLTRPVPGTECAKFARFAHRHVQLFLDGMHHPPRSTLPGSAATIEDLEQREA